MKILFIGVISNMSSSVSQPDIKKEIALYHLNRGT
jgi:hypothetical protein